MFNQKPKNKTQKNRHSTNINTKPNLRKLYRKSTMRTVASLMFVLMLLSAIVYTTTYNGSSSFVSAYTVDNTVYTESQLRAAVIDAVNATPAQYVIALGDNIELTTLTLTIPAKANVVLISAEGTSKKLVGPNGESTITVLRGSTLVLDGIIVTHNSGALGRGVYVDYGAVLTLNSGEITENNIYTGGAISENTFGGGVYNEGTVIINGGTIHKNSAYNGGGLYNLGIFKLNDGSFTKNKAEGAGGGIFNSGYSGTFTLTGGLINENTAGNGGGVYNYYAFDMTGGVISGNTANYYGGGVYNFRDATVTLEGDGVISKNTAGYDGGGVYNIRGATVTLKGEAVISGNTAKYYGGGVYNGGTFTISGGEIFGNAAINGGGIYTTSKITLTKGTITNNIAAVDGGAIYVTSSGYFELQAGMISGNAAGNNGGGIWVTNTDNIAALEKLYIMNGVVFKDNTASVLVSLPALSASETTIYHNQIEIDDGAWSNGEYYGINNYDISFMPKCIVVYAPGTQGTWQAEEETYTDLAFGSSTPVFGTNSGTDYTVDHTEGWTFAGWLPVWSAAVSGNVTYVAQWTKNVTLIFYAVQYDGNGFTGGIVPLGGSYPAGYHVLVAAQGSMVREGYSFQGWAYQSDATTADFATGTTAYLPLTGDTILFAVWKIELPPPSLSYTVSYLPGTYGTFSAVTYVCVLGDLTPQAPVVTGQLGWQFIGWTPEPTATVEGDAVYIAQWEPVVFVVQFVDWDGTLLKAETLPYGGNATAPANPSRNGYTFTGWNPTTFTNITADLIITAQYTQNNDGGNNGGGSQTNPPATTPPPSTTPPPPSTTPPPGGDNEEPLQSWALVNLVLSTTGLILALGAGVWLLLQCNQKQTNTPINDDTEKGYKKQKRRQRNVWLSASFALGIAGIAVFLFTEDLNRTMTLVDNWTIVSALILAAQLAAQLTALTVTCKHKKTPT